MIFFVHPSGLIGPLLEKMCLFKKIEYVKHLVNPEPSSMKSSKG